MFKHLPPERPDRPAGSHLLTGRTKTELPTEMASGGSFSEDETKEIKREPLPAETSPDAAPDKPLESSESPSAEPPGQDGGAASDGAAASIEGGKDCPASTDNRESRPGSSSEERAVKTNVFSFLSFPTKLWYLVESDEFKSICWARCESCIVIDEEMFNVEVLGRTGPQKIFEADSVKSFIRELNLYGFTKMKWTFPRSASLPKFMAEDAFSAHRKLLLYHNPNFKRYSPHLLINCNRRAALKRKATAAPATQADLDAKCPSSSSSGIQHGRGADAGQEKDGMEKAAEEDTQTAAPPGPLSQSARQKPPPRLAVPIQPHARMLPPCQAPLQRQQAGTINSLRPPPSCQHAAARAHLPLLLPHGTTFCLSWDPPCHLCSETRQLRAFPGLPDLPCVHLQVPGWQQPLPRPCQIHPTGSPQHPHTAQLAPAAQTGQLQAMGRHPSAGPTRDSRESGTHFQVQSCSQLFTVHRLIVLKIVVCIINLLQFSCVHLLLLYTFLWCNLRLSLLFFPQKEGQATVLTSM
eukprot:XP_027305491.1 heat shock transcription factor, X-linked-like [Anas platyrhynchos]